VTLLTLGSRLFFILLQINNNKPKVKIVALKNNEEQDVAFFFFSRDVRKLRAMKYRYLAAEMEP
jgi:hypothetical protein